MKNKKIANVDFSSAVWAELNEADFKKKASDLNVYGHLPEGERDAAIGEAYSKFNPQKRELPEPEKLVKGKSFAEGKEAKS